MIELECPECGSTNLRAFEVVLIERIWDNIHDDWVTDDAETVDTVSVFCDDCEWYKGGLSKLRSIKGMAHNIRLILEQRAQKTRTGKWLS